MSWELQRHPRFGGVRGPVVVCVMDGVGIGRHDESDAVWLARKPCLDRLAGSAVSTRLAAHGRAVGMPSDDDMGNSEVGHNALGAGRIFDQGAKLVDEAIASGSLFRATGLEAPGEAACAARASRCTSSACSPTATSTATSTTSSRWCAQADAEQDREAVRVHLLLDGRDVRRDLRPRLRRRARGAARRASAGAAAATTASPRAAGAWSSPWTATRPTGAIVERGWQTHVHGEGRAFRSAREAIETCARENPGVSDQVLPRLRRRR